MIRTEVLDPGRYNIIREVSCEAVETQLRCFGSVLNSMSFLWSRYSEVEKVGAGGSEGTYISLNRVR